MHLRLISSLVPPPNVSHSDDSDMSPLNKNLPLKSIQLDWPNSEGKPSFFLSTPFTNLFPQV